MKSVICLIPLLVFLALSAHATIYEVGPVHPFRNIGDVPWESIQAGDTVLIHWRAEPYREKWVIGRAGTANNPITVRGVPDGDGSLPVIDGRDATTRPMLNYWNEDRGVIKIGGANTPADTLPRYIVIENLDIRSGRPPYTFTGRSGLTEYRQNSAAIYLEKGEHITIRNCILRDSGNGFFSAHESSDVLIEGCYIYNNGTEGSYSEHNNYTESNGIIFQYNHFGFLRPGCDGNNLKDRSAGTVIRYNWIEGGNRQLDLVDSDHEHLNTDPTYRSTYVYGNILLEPSGDGNSQICHYGGDTGHQDWYRKGTLYFYNNTVISTRTDNTTLFRLSTNDESCDLRNNLIYTTASGNRLALTNSAGMHYLRNNWLKAGWGQSHEAVVGRISDLGGNQTGQDPGFHDFAYQQFWLQPGSPCIDAGTALAPMAEAYPVQKQYRIHRQWQTRPLEGSIDIGAYEYALTQIEEPEFPRWDVNADGTVDIIDLVLVGTHFGEDYRTIQSAAMSSEAGGDSNSEAQVWLEVQNKIGTQGPRLLKVDLVTRWVENLYGVVFDLSFDPNILEVVGVKPGDALIDDGSSAYWSISGIDNRAGKIRDVTHVRKGTGRGLNTQGTLASFVFDVKQADISEESHLTVTDIQLADAKARRIQAVTKNLALNWEDLSVPLHSGLLPNYPNPFNPETWLPYQLADEQHIVIRIYNAQGDLIRKLIPGKQPAGLYLSKNRATYWDGRNASGERVSSGVYYYSVSATGFRNWRRMLLVK